MSAWIYDTHLGAAAGAVRLADLRRRRVLTVHDAVTVTWVAGVEQPRIGHLRRETSAIAAGGSTLGALLGVLLFSGARVNDVDELAGRLSGTGVDRAFLEQVRDRIVPGTSGLLALTSDIDLEDMRPVIESGLARGDVDLTYVSLPESGPEALRVALRDAAQGLDLPRP